MAALASGDVRNNGVESGPALRMSALSMTFPTMTEQAFMESRLQAMRTGISNSFTLGGLVLMLLGIRDLLVADFVCMEGLCTLQMAASVLLLLIAAAMRMPHIESVIGFRTCECVTIVTYLALLLIIATPAKWSTTELPESEYDRNWQLMHEYKRALQLDTIVTVTHLVIPIRWKVVVWADLLYMIVFVIRGVLIGFPYTDLGFALNIQATFAALVFGASLGLRVQESAKRELFLGLIYERTQKTLAEAVAEGGIRPGSSLPTRPPSVSHASVPETTLTGEFFRALQMDDWTRGATSEHAIANEQHELQLNRLKEIGVKEHWFIDMANVGIDFPIDILGRGGYGMVVRGSYCGTAVAVKMVSKIGTNGNSLINELRFLRQLRHPHLVTFFGLAMREDTLFVVMELVAGDTLQEYVSALRSTLRGSSSATVSPCPEQGEAMRGLQVVMRGVAQALVFLHSQKPCVVHCDLKPDNIIITHHRDTGPFAKLLDFGLAAAGTRYATVDGGTAKFMAPEASSAEHRARARPAVDIYAVGRLLCYTATLGSSVEVPEPGSAECSPLLQAWTPLIMACLSRDPSQRPTARDLDAQLAEQIDPAPATPWHLQDCQALALPVSL